MVVPAAIEVDPAAEEAELAAYLGRSFDRSRLERHESLLEEEAARVGDEQILYRTSEAYLYDLTAFAMSGTKVPYIQLLTRHLAPGARVLDYGCGIGSDGLMLLEAGYRVEFADFVNPSTSYLAWRLRRRGLSAPIHDLDAGVPAGFDAAYSFDVIEHVDDPLGFLAQLEARADMVMVNLLEYEPNHQTLHRRLPMGRLLGHVAARGLVDYRVMHTSSHVVLYRPQRAGWQAHAANLATMAVRGGLRAAWQKARHADHRVSRS